jgi:CBS domain containing-hemolysin-like protein
MALLIVFFLLSILFSFLCSIWEAVLLSITPKFVKSQKLSNPEFGNTLEVYKKDIDRPLSAILTLNTIAHTVGAIGVGAQASTLFDNTTSFSLGPISLTYESLIAGVMTLAILILSEIIPKTLGANNWEKLSGFTISSLKILMFLLYPFVWFSQWITKHLKKEEIGSVLSRSDFHSMAEEGKESGVLNNSESTIIQNLMKLKGLVVEDIMTPRTVFVAANEELSLEEYYSKNKPIRYSRIPLFKDSKDHISGVALKDDILSSIVEGNGTDTLKSINREVIHVYNSTSLHILFDKLTDEKAHLAIVVDRYGSVVGLVTMEDLLETLLGLEITDEMDNIEDLQKYAKSVWKNRAQQLGLEEH